MVLSPQMLWNEYNRNSLPLDVTLLASKETEFGTEKHVYFNGEATASGCTRIYARYFAPKVSTDKLILLMVKPETDVCDVDITPYEGGDRAILIVDYAGNINDRMRFTIYPSSLSFANYSPDDLYVLSESPQKTCHYVWTTVCLRAITFAESEGYTKIALVGEELGGASIMRTAAICDYPLCASAFFSPGFFPTDKNPELMELNISLGVTGYSQILKVPFLHQCCSNDADSSLDDISELSNMSIKNDILYISKRSENPCQKDIINIMPRSNRYVSERLLTNLRKFISAYLDNEISEDTTENLAPDVSLTVTGAARKMYFSIKCEKILKEVNLYVSHGVTNPAYRNWRKLPLEKAGANEYIGFTEVYAADKPIYAFAKIKTENDFVYTTQLVTKIPSALKIVPTTIVKRRLIYDSDMGINDFFTEDKKNEPKIEQGPYSISGICAHREICTYKLGDVAYSGEPDSNLQLLIFSPVEQDITFNVTDSEQFMTYTCKKHVSPATDWTKIMISRTDLKSSEGIFKGWDTAILLKINSDEDFIISSMLWV